MTMANLLVFATGNPNKIKEVNQLLEGEFYIRSLNDIGCSEDIPETSDTIEGNAIQKAMYVFKKYSVDCFSEDTGLEINALGGQPGVLSARYAGDSKDPEANIRKVLSALEQKKDRTARFKTVVALVLSGQVHTFEGVAEGNIRMEKSGNGGFGYDPIFEPKGYDLTFAELSDAEKNRISHRGKALQQLISFLKHKV